MTRWAALERSKIIRLNARLMPVYSDEARLYQKYHLNPLQVEAATPDELIPLLADCDGLFAVSVKLPEAVILNLTRCQIISRLGTGTDRIDIAAAERQGIVVANVPEFCTEEMADHTMAMLLSLIRRLPQMSRHLLSGEYAQAREEEIRIPRISGLVLGLVGFGASARAVARRAQSFGLNVIATRRRMDVSREEMDLLGVKLVDLGTLLAQSDIVSLHLPLTSETYQLLDANRLRQMKRGAYLLNTARGALVDETALAELLEEGYLGGAGLDTFKDIEIFVENPAPPKHPLTALENVILTPHVSGLSAAAMEQVHRTGIENLAAVLSGYWPAPGNIVNPRVTPRIPLAPYEPELFAMD
ncbi:MAG: C-terminal binding protein [Anaerolineae bacterium]|nr:C-terminal binding protein [Anaerolineae bacterium]